MRVTIVGAGLAGCESALYLADNGVKVKLYEMRPKVQTGAHSTDKFGEFVCSNSLGSIDTLNASGLLKKEIEILGSNLIDQAYKNRVPSGNSLSIDREGFSDCITSLIKNHKNIEVINEECEKIDENEVTIIASGPLTSDKLSNYIKSQTGETNFHFFDAIAPIITKDSIDFDKAFYASRWDKGEADFINCPFTKEEYENFYNILINSERAPIKEFEAKYFEGCMPVEVIASRGVDTLRYGPMKPVGLFDSRTRQEEHKNYQFYAAVQLRQDDKQANLYNLVGFQTNLKWGEQKKLIQSIPALENAQIVRYGVMHANTFINSPKILNKHLQTKFNKNLFFAGQITGVEGYCESIATGLLSAINVLKYLKQEPMLELSSESMLGALVDYITFDGHKNFQPVNSNFGIIAPMEMDKKIRRDKKEKYKLFSNRALNYIKEIKNGISN